MMLYVLDANNQPVKVEQPTEWIAWCKANPDPLGWRQEGELSVITTFLGINCNTVPDGPPILWETQVIGGDHNGFAQKYQSYDDAVRGHAETCRLVFGTEAAHV